MKALLVITLISMFVTPASIFVVSESPQLLGEEPDEELPKDEAPPESAMIAAPKLIITNSYEAALLSWRGSDGDDGSGISHYDVQVKIAYLYDPNVDVRACVMPFWQDYLMNTTETYDSFHPPSNGIYYFRVRAIDNAGNVEEWPEYFDTFILGLGWDRPTSGFGNLKGEVRDRIEDHLELIDDIGDIDPREQVKQIRANEPPVADAGEDINEVICIGPYVYEDARDYVEQKGWYDYTAEAEFNGSGSYDPDGEIMYYIWDFGDGTIGFGEQPTHTYIYPGEYEVTLLVVDDSWGYDQDTLMCSIEEVCF